jgi:hypothetical protein
MLTEALALGEVHIKLPIQFQVRLHHIGEQQFANQNIMWIGHILLTYLKGSNGCVRV